MRVGGLGNAEEAIRLVYIRVVETTLPLPWACIPSAREDKGPVRSLRSDLTGQRGVDSGMQVDQESYHLS